MASVSSFHKKWVEIGKVDREDYLKDIHHARKADGNCAEVASDPTWFSNRLTN